MLDGTLLGFHRTTHSVQILHPLGVLIGFFINAINSISEADITK